MAQLLPAGFEALEPFADRFAVAGTAARAQRRTHSAAAERTAFFAAARDLIGPALDQLDAKPLGQLDDAERRLLDMALTFAHVALAVEVHGADEPRHAAMRECMRITRSPADAPA